TATATPTSTPVPTSTPTSTPAPPTAPAEEPGLAVPPQLKELVPAEVPPGTVFPAPEVAVVLQIDVSALGQVEDVRIEQGAGEPFDSAALAAARRFAFTPGRLTTGEAVPVTITFRLRIAAPVAAPAEPAAPAPPRPVKLSGRLLERGTRKPLANAAVAARSEDGATTYARGTTDADGRFALEVPAAAFVLVGAAAGHERLEARVEAKPGEEREETIYLESTVGSNVSIVRGERVRREITKQVIPADEVAAVAGTQGDTLKAVLNLPGAARSAFGGGELILRGSSPGDSAAFIDGLEVPIAYHFGGLRSTFAPRFLESLEFVPGNFAPDYGRLTGGIVNVRARDPVADAIHGEADLNLYDAGVAVEGPLSRTWSGGAAFRRSWIDTILPLVLPSDSNLSFSTAPRFYDYQFIATWRPDERDRVRFLFFGSQDKLVALLERPAGNDPSLSGDLRARIAYHFLQASWSRSFGPTLRHESWIAAGMQEIDTQFGPRLFFDLATRRLDLRSTWSWQARPSVEARAGVDVQRAWYDISLDVPQVPKEGEPPTPISSQGDTISASDAGTYYAPAAFAELRLSPRDGIDVIPSVRVDWNSPIRRWSADPRLVARWRVAPRTVLKGAAGVYQQPPAPDESSVFSGSPDLLPKRTYQYSAGVEHQPIDGVELEVTGFYKDLSRNVVRNLASEVDPSQPVYLNSGEGRIFGVETLLRARFGDRFFGWIAYTFQRSLRTDRPGEAERRFDYDQPHILTAIASWRRNTRWTFGARFRLVSGNPYTPVDAGRAVYDAGGDVWVPVYSAVNSARLAPFNALDLRVDRNWTYDRWRLSAYVDVQNVYNRANPEGWEYRFDYGERARLTGLPILPILGLKGEW
ncbi:MAG TPA: TonB family protein, partial [Anaeromyxobacter sp.]|nr:TonB family protein [Anaeromyxobacter sp.]